MSAYPRHAGVEQAVLEAHALEQTPFFGALARRHGAGKARELTLVATAGRWNAENNGHTHDEAQARLFVHKALLSAGVNDAEAATISQSFPLSAFDRAQIASSGSAASLGHITAQAAAKAEEAKTAKNQRYHDLSALMAGTASDHPGKAKSFFDARGQTALDRAGSGGEGKRSSASYDDMAAHDWGSPAGLAKMRGYAMEAGIPWAASNPELLRLGPSAVQALADVHFRQESYRRLTHEASFEAKDVVTLAKFAKRHKLDANKLAGQVSDDVKSIAGNNKPLRREVKDVFVGDMTEPTNPADAAAHRARIDRKADEVRKKLRPEQQQKFDGARHRLHEQAARTHTQENSTAQKERKAAGNEQKANDELASLNSTPATKPNSTSPTKHPAPAKTASPSH
jgi:hypothetical protein